MKSGFKITTSSSRAPWFPSEDRSNKNDLGFLIFGAVKVCQPLSGERSRVSVQPWSRPLTEEQLASWPLLHKLA